MGDVSPAASADGGALKVCCPRDTGSMSRPVGQNRAGHGCPPASARISRPHATAPRMAATGQRHTQSAATAEEGRPDEAGAERVTTAW